MKKELSLAFVWHFHQPNYQVQPNGIRLMPWARLHAIKDYLDMLLILDKYPKLKLNFSIDPALLDTIEDYSNDDVHDIHSKLTVTPVENLTPDDKLYILNYFFDANYDTLISKNPRFNELYVKRFSSEEISIDSFSDNDYSDIMMLFNLVWFDPIWKNVYPVLNEFAAKGQNYTLADRIALINLNREIIRQIIPTFKKYLDNGRIEIITTPYNHPIMPILINPNDLKTPTLKNSMPDFNIALLVDLKEEIKMAIDKITRTFGKPPKGIWPSEHCISQKTLDVAANSGFKWIITDESVLSNSLNKDFVRDFRGCFEDPYDVCSLYLYKTKREKEINLIFRDSVIPKLIGFEYAHRDNEACANDLFDRIKNVYDKLKKSPDKKHLLTIAMDGENSWDSYQEDGSIFLNKLYSLINEDKTIKTVLISDYVEENKNTEKTLKKITAGSWVNQDFQLWIAEPTKNLAWKYLVEARREFINAQKEGSLSKEQIKAIKSEIYIAEGSDWFWWYGEPNNSGQDHIFDFLFREHLMNIYNLMRKPVPEYLQMPLISVMGKPSKIPRRQITPLLNGKSEGNDEWLYAGCIDIPAGPILQENKLFNRIYFGCDTDNLYLRFDINKYFLDKKKSVNEYIAIYIYFKTYNNTSSIVSIPRPTNKAGNIFPVLQDGYTDEVKIALTGDNKYALQYSKAIKDGLWELQLGHEIKYVRDEILEISVPFKDLRIENDERFDFFCLAGFSGITEEVYPKDIPLSLIR